VLAPARRAGGAAAHCMRGRSRAFRNSWLAMSCQNRHSGAVVQSECRIPNQFLLAAPCTLGARHTALLLKSEM
jgi:hypothetical protein